MKINKFRSYGRRGLSDRATPSLAHRSRVRLQGSQGPLPPFKKELNHKPLAAVGIAGALLSLTLLEGFYAWGAALICLQLCAPMVGHFLGRFSN